jgi:4-hydroxybenzoate polyprenyltransferase
VVRLVHPAPAITVTGVAAVLAVILAADAGRPWIDGRVLLVALAVGGSQVFTGALNDWADRARDAGRHDKPLAAGEVRPAAALWLALGGAVVQVLASLPLGTAALILGLLASASAAAYSLWLSRTPLSLLPYLVSFGILPLWIAAGIGVGPGRVVGASLLVAPFATAAHLANVLRDFETDARAGSRSLPQVIGRRATHLLAVALALGTAVGVGAVLVVGERSNLSALAFGAVGIAAVGLGATDPRRLWFGILTAAVAWTAAWGLATG